MKNCIKYRIHMLIVSAFGLLVIMLFAACGSASSTSTGSTGTTTHSLSGTVQGVNSSQHYVILVASANGQQQAYVIGGLSDQQVAQLQSQVGQTYTIQVTQNGNEYTITPNTNLVPVNTNVTSVTPTITTTTQQPAVNLLGKIDFIGKVQSVNANSLVVSMPNGDTLQATITNFTDRHDLLTGPTSGQQIKIEAVTNTDGSFAARKLGQLDPEDQANPAKLNKVDFAGVTTSAVGSDNVLHFKVGGKNYSFTITPTTQVKDFVSVQGIPANQPVKAEVLFNGASGNLLQVENANS